MTFHCLRGEATTLTSCVYKDSALIPLTVIRRGGGGGRGRSGGGAGGGGTLCHCRFPPTAVPHCLLSPPFTTAFALDLPPSLPFVTAFTHRPCALDPLSLPCPPQAVEVADGLVGLQLHPHTGSRRCGCRLSRGARRRSGRRGPRCSRRGRPGSGLTCWCSTPAFLLCFHCLYG